MPRPFLPKGAGSPRVIAALAATILLATVLAGCVTGRSFGEDPGELTLSAHWASWMDEPLPHLHLDLKDVGGGPLTVGPDAQTIVITGPNGTIPIHWETFTSRDLQPGENVTLILHPRAGPNGHFQFSIDHVWGQPKGPVSGSYLVCFGSTCAPAILGGAGS